MEPFRQLRRIDHTKHEVYISFQASRRVFLGLSASTIHSQRNVFSFKRCIHCFSPMCELISLTGSRELSSSLDGRKKYILVGW